MQIGCTKKLQEQINLNIETIEEVDDIFSWSANLVILNRRKTVVVVNDYSRYGFVLYGLKAKDFKNIENLLLQGIKRTLTGEKIKPELIEKYFEDAKKIKFTKTKSPRCVARLNKACELVGWFREELDQNEIYQSSVTKRLNKDILKHNNEHRYSYELLQESFKNLYGENIFQSECVDFVAKINLGENTVFRRIVAPLDMSFKQFHNIIQKLFNWKDCHLYDFTIIDNEDNIIERLSSNQLEDLGLEETSIDMKSKMPLRDYYKSNYKIIYTYDFGDNWEHEITIRDMKNDYNKNYPVCLMGEGTAPPEDVGGVDGFEDFLRILSNPDDEEYESTIEWGLFQGYKEFDIDSINRNLKYDFIVY
ncbi:MAG: plasmid pRiA4b ORF-3 family protein [Terrisporobacter sp.]